MSTPLLRCERLAKNFGQVPAVRSVNLDVQPGEILAVIGPLRLRKNDSAAPDRRFRAARRRFDLAGSTAIGGS